MLQVCSFLTFQRDSGLMKSLKNLILIKIFLLRFMNHLRLRVLSYLKLPKKQVFLLQQLLSAVPVTMLRQQLVQVLLKMVKPLLLSEQAVLYLLTAAKFLSTLRDEFTHSAVLFPVHGMSWALLRLPVIHLHGISTIWV